MTPKQQLDKFLAEGCLVMHCPTGTLHTVADAAIQPREVVFCTMFPEDQHHTHRLAYTSLNLPHTRGLEVWDGSTFVGYFAPHNEWPALDQDSYLEERVRWRNYLQDPDNRAMYERFLDSTLEV